MKRLLNQILPILKRPFTLVLLLIYYIAIFALKVTVPVFAGLLNIFTLLFIPVTGLIIYAVWNIFYNENIGDEMFDEGIKKKYFNIINSESRKNLEKLMQMREEIQKLSKKSHINPGKEDLIYKIKSLDLNDLIQKYANNSVKVKFVEDFLNKKSSNMKKVNDKIQDLNTVKAKFEKLNDDIIYTFESIQAQAVLILTDDVTADVYSKETIDEVMEKVKSLDTSNKEINKFYISLHKGGDYE